jgi:hypothetical protein
MAWSRGVRWGPIGASRTKRESGELLRVRTYKFWRASALSLSHPREERCGPPSFTPSLHRHRQRATHTDRTRLGCLSAALRREDLHARFIAAGNRARRLAAKSLAALLSHPRVRQLPGKGRSPVGYCTSDLVVDQPASPSRRSRRPAQAWLRRRCGGRRSQTSELRPPPPACEVRAARRRISALPGYDPQHCRHLLALTPCYPGEHLWTIPTRGAQYAGYIKGRQQ